MCESRRVQAPAQKDPRQTFCEPLALLPVPRQGGGLRARHDNPSTERSRHGIPLCTVGRTWSSPPCSGFPASVSIGGAASQKQVIAGTLAYSPLLSPIE